MDGDALSSLGVKATETPSSTKPVSKSRYSSCLSSFRNNYKPSNSSKPSNVSSPILVVEKKTTELGASPSHIPQLPDALIPPLCSPSISSTLLPQDTAFIDISAPSPFKDKVKQGTSNSGNYMLLTGVSGNWQGPNSSDMTPESKRRPQFRQGSGFRNSRGGRDAHMGGLNSSTPNHSFGRNNCDGYTSFNSSQGGFSPYNSPGRNSSNNRGTKRGFQQSTPSVDISSYYSPAMTQDPWAGLVRDKKYLRDNSSASQNDSKTSQYITFQ